MSGTPPQIFVILTGVSGNLGDAVIRRRVLEWCRGRGQIHAYVGRTTPGWIEQLALRPDEAVYGAGKRRTWLRKLLFGRGPRALMFDPGEVPLGRSHLKSEALFALITIILRLRGATVVRPPRAIAHYSALTGALHWVGCALSQETLWRNQRSIQKMRVGVLVPDTAFHEPEIAGAMRQDRDTIVISLRGRRPAPPQTWYEAISAFASENALKIQIMSQVDEDEERSAEIADGFSQANAKYFPWSENTDVEQERAVRLLYERAAFVISDRLHVLILSAVAGAEPIEVVESPNVKVREHFATIGMNDISLDIVSKSADEILEFLNAQRFRRDELDPLLKQAWRDLDSRVEQIRTLIGVS